ARSESRPPLGSTGTADFEAGIADDVGRTSRGASGSEHRPLGHARDGRIGRSRIGGVGRGGRGRGGLSGGGGPAPRPAPGGVAAARTGWSDDDAQPVSATATTNQAERAAFTRRQPTHEVSLSRGSRPVHWCRETCIFDPRTPEKRRESAPFRLVVFLDLLWA